MTSVTPVELPGASKAGKKKEIGPRSLEKKSMYIAYWECWEEKGTRRTCPSFLHLQVIKDRCYVHGAIELRQQKLAFLSNKDCSVSFSSKAGNEKPSTGYQMRNPEIVVVYALLLPGTARRACYLCNMCDLPQEIHPVMTTDYVYIWGIEMHP